MSGAPIARARDAARTFINSIGENDPVAILAFSNTIRLVQDFTSDKTALLNALDALRIGGATPLYQGAYEGIEQTADSPVPRRAMILLSDGAEYGGLSRVARDEVSEQALARGVPVYTIGLGFGTDRSFLEQLSTSTNARFYESPTPEELVEIYAELAALLRSQYAITLSADLPLDGTEYDLGLRVVSDENSATANAILRAPIPVPIVRLPELPDEPIESSIDITATVLADDPITSVQFVAGDQSITYDEEPFNYPLDPMTFQPGTYSITVTAEDADGDVGTAEDTFTVAALPSSIFIEPDITALGEIAEETLIRVEIVGQTPPTSIQYSLIGPEFPDGQLQPVSEDGFIVLNPQTLVAGDNLLTLEVTNEGGVTTSTAFPFSVAELPPIITISGIQDGQIIDAPASFEVTGAGQTEAIEISASVGDVALEPDEVQAGNFQSSSTFTIDPMQIEPGPQTLTITASDENEQTGSQTTSVIISPLPPVIIVNGLAEGDLLEQDTQVDLEFISQTPVTRVTLLLDGEDLAHLASAPYSTPLRPAEIGAGEHTLRIVAENTSNQSATLDINFSVGEGPSLTATALVPTATTVPTSTLTPSATPDRNATNTQIALETQNAAEQATQNVLMTASAEVIASATNDARTTAQAAAQAEMQQSTRDALATANMQARVEATQTSDARATRNAAVTQTESINATASALAATQTSDARGTRLAQSNATATAQAQLAATETAAAELTATRSALETQVFESQATVDAGATSDAMETRNAQATERANQTATAIQQATIDTRLAAVGLSATPEETDLTSVAQLETGTPRPTTTPQPTLTMVETESPPAQGDIIPVVIIGIVLLILLVVVYLILSSRRRQRQQ